MATQQTIEGNTVQVVNEYVNIIKNNTDYYSNQFIQYANNANNESQNNIEFVRGVFDVSNAETVQLEGVDDFRPSRIDDFRLLFDTRYKSLVSTLEQTVPNEFSKFLNAYFPKPSNFDKLEKFLVDSVLNGSIGLPPEVEKQIWERSRQRIELSNHKQIMENRKSMASRGFIVPNGVEKYSELIIRNEGNKNIAGDSSNIAIESAKLRIEWIKTAVAEARNYRSIALDSAFKYLASVLSIHDPSLRFAAGSVDSFQSFYNASNSYSNSIASLNNLKLEKAKLVDNYKVQYDKFLIDQVINNENQKTNTLTELARLMGAQASAALSGMNSMATLSSTAIVDAAAQ